MIVSLLAQTKSERLIAQSLLMTHYQPQRALAANVKVLIESPAFSTTFSQLRDAQLELMNAWNAEADDELQDKLTMTEVSVGQQIVALKAAPMVDKHIVLASMPVIEALYAALSLGVTELAFKHFIAFHHDIFGQCYMNQRRYSLDELMLIESNPEWLSGYRRPPVPAAVLKPNYLQFVRYTVVEEKVAMAYCNITRDELSKVAYVINHDFSVYHLADLDKIRVAKLKAQQQ